MENRTKGSLERERFAEWDTERERKEEGVMK